MRPPKFLECSTFAFKKKHQKSLLSSPPTTHFRHRKRKKEMVKITKSTRSLFLSAPFVALFLLSLSLSFVVPTPFFLSLCFRLLSLSSFRAFVRVFLCVSARVFDLRLGVLFPFQPQVFLPCVHARTDLFLSLSRRVFVLIQFAASAPATSVGRPWP